MAVFLITAPSGAGKSTLAQTLASRGLWQEFISHTTREKREGEVNGKSYYFVSSDEFEKLIDDDSFAEYVEYDGNYYGLSNKEIYRVKNKRQHAFAIVEFEGYKQIKSQYPDAISIFLHMSKEDCVANMLLRGDALDKVLKRAEKYDEEMENRLHYDYVIKNVRDMEKETLDILENIIEQNIGK